MWECLARCEQLHVGIWELDLNKIWLSTCVSLMKCYSMEIVCLFYGYRLLKGPEPGYDLVMMVEKRPLKEKM